jgi:hypothetical protein
VIVELRQYTLRPGEWAVLAGLFERALAESQEAVGMTILGWFRDLDDPDRFVWLRAFPDMARRAPAPAPAAFYGGPVWAEHREAANATMVDAENVLLLRPARAEAGSSLNRGVQFVVSIHQFPEPVDNYGSRAPRARAGTSQGDPGHRGDPNDFPALPVREGEHAVVRFSDREDACADELLRLASP